MQLNDARGCVQQKPTAGRRGSRSAAFPVSVHEKKNQLPPLRGVGKFSGMQKAVSRACGQAEYMRMQPAKTTCKKNMLQILAWHEVQDVFDGASTHCSRAPLAPAAFASLRLEIQILMF